jgi:hypothetical protein
LPFYCSSPFPEVNGSEEEPEAEGVREAEEEPEAEEVREAEEDPEADGGRCGSGEGAGVNTTPASITTSTSKPQLLKISITFSVARNKGRRPMHR